MCVVLSILSCTYVMLLIIIVRIMIIRTVNASSGSAHYSYTSVEHMLVQSGVKLSIM